MSVIDDSARARAGQRPGAAALRKVTVVSNIWALRFTPAPWRAAALFTIAEDDHEPQPPIGYRLGATLS
jgi:hypothetical protein